jgi:hypothetical protein
MYRSPSKTSRSGAVVVASLMGACGGSDAPLGPVEPAPLEVALTSTVLEKGWVTQDTEYRCSYVMTATTSGGDDGELLEWVSGDVAATRPNGRRATTQFTERDLRDLWGSGEIGWSEIRTAEESATWDTHFQLRYTFTLRARGGDRELTRAVSLDCT